MAKNRQAKKQRQRERQQPTNPAFEEATPNQPEAQTEAGGEDFTPSERPRLAPQEQKETAKPEKKPKAKNKSDEEKVGLLKRFWRFLKSCKAELEKVIWPNKEQLARLTMIVLVFVVLIGVYLGALDYIFSRAVQELIG